MAAPKTEFSSLARLAQFDLQVSAQSRAEKNSGFRRSSDADLPQGSDSRPISGPPSKGLGFRRGSEASATSYALGYRQISGPPSRASAYRQGSEASAMRPLRAGALHLLSESDRPEGREQKVDHHKALERLWKEIQPQLEGARAITNVGEMMEAFSTPAGAGAFRNVTYLSPARMRLASFPNEMFKLPLTALDLNGMQLTELPEGLFGLTSLKTLDIGANFLRNLDPRIVRLQSLTVLNIGTNLFQREHYQAISRLLLDLPHLKAQSIANSDIFTCFQEEMIEARAIQLVWSVIKDEVMKVAAVAPLLHPFLEVEQQLKRFRMKIVHAPPKSAHFFNYASTDSLHWFDSIPILI